MKRYASLVGVLILSAACGSNPAGPSNSGPIVFTATLMPANEVPSIGAADPEGTGSGTVRITFNVSRDSSGVPNGGGTADFAVQVSGFPAGTTIIGAHIHGPSTPTTTANVIISTGLTNANTRVLANGSDQLSFNGIGPISQDLATQIYNNPGNYYFNIHSPLHTGGFARGTLARQQ